MPSKTLTAAIVAAGTLSLPAVAQGAVASAQRYHRDYRAVASRFGTRAPGRNILRYGMSTGGRADEADLLRSIGVLERMLHPAPVPAVAHVTHTTLVRHDGDGDTDGDMSDHAPVVAHHAPAPAPAPVAASPAPASSSATGGYTIPSCIVQHESGGNWRAVNPSSGAGGAYQIMPQTWQAYGGSGLPQNASPSQQSAIASKIWHSAGPSAWATAAGCGF